MKKKIVYSGLLGMLCLISCNSKKDEQKVTEKYAVTNPILMDTVFKKEYVAQIKSVQNIELRAQEKGFLQKIYVDEGQYVQAGQVLFRISQNIYQAELLKAQADAKQEEIELENTKLLANKNIVSKNELAMNQAKLEHARAEVSLAKLHLSYTDIKAPFSGTIDRIPKKLGSLIDEGELLTTLSDNSNMFAYFNVSEPEYLQYQTNAKDRADNQVDLKLANGEMHKYKGKIEVIEGEFDNETGNISFRAKFPNNEKLLRNGETGDVVMTVPAKNVLIIPQKATYEIQDKIYVFVIDKNNIAKSKEIEIAGELPDLYVVKSGLNKNDKILLEGVQSVKDDDKIEFTYQKPQTVISQLKLKAE